METLSLAINGEKVESLIDPKTTLQKFLHDTLRLTGTKEGCGSGLCGCCTVMVDGQAVKSCLIFALQVRGKSIQTIEGLAHGDTLDPRSECVYRKRRHSMRVLFGRNDHVKQSAFGRKPESIGKRGSPCPIGKPLPLYRIS